jgi:diguanylate cyclase (GGDEF)-like protein/PAS domain S-box-containing protein
MRGEGRSRSLAGKPPRRPEPADGGQALLELQAILENATVGILFSRNRLLVQANPLGAQMFGYAADELLGQPGRILYPSNAAYQALGAEAGPVLGAGRSYQTETDMRRKDGTVFRCRLSAKAVDPAHPNGGTIWIMEDVSAQYEAQQLVRQALAEQEMIFDNAAVGIVFARNRRVHRCNRRFEEIFDWPAGELPGRSMRVLYPSEATFADHSAEADEIMANDGVYVAEVQMKRKSGGLLWVRATGRRANAAGSEFDIVWIFEDVTERRDAEEALRRARDELEERVSERTTELTSANMQLQKEIFERMQAEQRIWHVAHHDALTGLPNRALLHDRLEQALTQASRDGHRVAVMFIDLDRFKSINDSLGHAIGDGLLRHVGERLNGVVRAVDTVSRHGGDEFIVVLRQIAGTEDAILVAEKIIAALAVPLLVQGHELRATPSIGISIYPDDGTEAMQLMKNADTAMYHAKALGRNNFQFFTARMNEEATRVFHLEQQLRHALDANQLLLHFQPQVNMQDRAVCGMEALVRWLHPDLGMMSPADFIPVAEDSGMILPLGEWVLAEALHQNRRWQEAGYPLLPIAVNLSPRQFRQKGLVASVRRLLAETGQPARLLELEITESSLMQDVDEALEKVRELAAMGVQLVIDDFGTGYSSLNHLKRFPVHKLKIDQSFVRDLGVDWDDGAIVAAIVGLARALNLETLAEGVETAEQLKMLRNYGCHRFQGFYFSRPLAADQADALFRPSGLLSIT